MKKNDYFFKSLEQTSLLIPEEDENVQWGPLVTNYAPAKRYEAAANICGAGLAIFSAIVICILFASTAIRSIEQLFFSTEKLA